MAWGGGEADDVVFFLFAGIVDKYVEHEAVELGLGEGVGAFLFDGVLGGHDEKGFGEAVLDAAGGDLVFLHGFQECGLGFGGGAVDFVGEDRIGEDGAADEAEGAFAGHFFFFDDFGAGDVGGHEVGGKLDAVEGERKGFRESGDQEGFGEAGDADEEAVAAAEEGDQEFFHDLGLADDDLSQFGLKSGVGSLKLLDIHKFVRGELGDIVGLGHGCSLGGR